ncbi:MAG TPA: hypothetical protein PLM66_11990, partial [Candidatus Latescibacteria bacterium]|nr:hypothetical protein [Candidatus Latescibacterota bacterium]
DEDGGMIHKGDAQVAVPDAFRGSGPRRNVVRIVPLAGLPAESPANQIAEPVIRHRYLVPEFLTIEMG